MASAKTLAHGLEQSRAEFPIFDRQIYLNTCSLGALSRRSRQRVAQFLEDWAVRGAAAWYDVWWERLANLRRGYAELIGAGAHEVALHASISTATAVVASALDYRRRPKVVTTALDFPTTAYQWLAKQSSGVQVIVLESPDGISVPVDRFEDAVDDRTSLVVTSHVYFTTGAIQDIRAVAAVAHARGALCLIDAYQSLGQIPADVREADVDFLVGGGLKWLLGGPGIAFLYVREALGQRLTPSVTGWFADAEQFRFDPRRITFHDDARRFEQGTPALAAVHAQLGGLELLADLGFSDVFRVTRELTDDLVERAREAGLRPAVAPDPAQRSAIVTLPTSDPPRAVARLAEAGIVVDARPGLVRLSPFFYNVRDDGAAAIDLLRP